jgi:putative PEP-CTERM system integral membrane protein
MKSVLEKVLGYGLFWSWNVLFLVFVAFGFTPMFGISILTEWFGGDLPWGFLAYGLLLCLLPLSMVVLAAAKLRSAPAKLLGVLFAVEGPLFVLSLIRLFLLRELNPAMTFLVAGIWVSAAAYLFEQLRAQRRGPVALNAARLVASTASALLGAYLAALVLFYAIPLGLYLIKGFFGFQWASTLWQVLVSSRGMGLPVLLIGLVVFTYAATLVVALPFAMPWLHLRSWRAVMKDFGALHGRPTAWAVAGATALAVCVVFAFSTVQPQRAVLARLKAAPRDRAELTQRLKDADTLRAGLVSAYLGSYRYSLTLVDNHVAHLYRNDVGLSDEAADAVEAAFRQVARPFIYDGDDFLDDHKAAAAQYEALFDVPIQKAERVRVRGALTANLQRDQVQAGLLNIDEERVRLARQEVQVEEHADLADLELHEVYVNTTSQQQEVQFLFTLPTSAALTGLWLGPTEDRAKRDVFVVAPRGAAQQVYREEVQRRADPALLEQIGPRQYRLRAFPIPPKARSGQPPAELHLWLTWRVLAAPEGWPAPRLLERRNVFWDSSTTRTLRGERLDEKGWLPPFLPRRSTEAPAPHRAQLSDGTFVEATPGAPRLPGPAGLKVAVVVDRTLSLEKREKELRNELDQLGRVESMGNEVHLYFTSAKDRPDAAYRRMTAAARRDDDLLFYGAQSVQSMLAQFSRLSEKQPYDAVLLLTDDDAYEAAEDCGEVTVDSPLWVVHLGGALARGYDDKTLALLQRSGSGVAATAGEALDRVALWARPDPSLVAWQDGYVWRAAESAPESDERFAALAARQVLAAQARSGAALDVEHLDRLHGLAKHYGIVTPWSSMLVLVSDEQRQKLAEAEAKDDRFKREHESGKENLSPNSGVVNLSGAPEPHEWALIFVAAAALAWVAWDRRARRRDPG